MTKAGFLDRRNRSIEAARHEAAIEDYDSGDWGWYGAWIVASAALRVAAIVAIPVGAGILIGKFLL